MTMGGQPYSSWYVLQRYSEDTQGPHDDMLPQWGVSCQRPKRPGPYGHPLAPGQTVHL
jgi:hypothetical protein